MKQFPQTKPSPAQPYELVNLYLDVGQCRYIYAMLQRELFLQQKAGVTDINDALHQLKGHLEQYAYPTSSQTIHRDLSVDEFLVRQNLNDLNDLLSVAHVHGALDVESLSLTAEI